MKTTRINTILRSAVLASAVAIGLLASTANAQILTSYQASARIPFAFRAGSKQMPAGQYRISFKSNRLVFQEQDPGKYLSAILTVTPSEDGKIKRDGRLVFTRYGNQYFLRQVWQADSTDGGTCIPSPEEKAIVRSQNQQALTTEVAFNVDPNR